MVFRPTVDPGNPSGRASINPAVECLVAFPKLLPFEFGKAALVLYRDQLLGRQLLQPFGIDPARQMKKAGRKPLPIPRVLISTES